MSSQSTATATAGGGCGCTSIILFFILIWALVFGITLSGVHYSLSCNTERGVEIRQEARNE